MKKWNKCGNDAHHYSSYSCNLNDACHYSAWFESVDGVDGFRK